MLGWHIAAPESLDADGYSLYSDESSKAGVQRVTPASSLNLAGLAVDQLEWRRFMNWGGMVGGLSYFFGGGHVCSGAALEGLTRSCTWERFWFDMPGTNASVSITCGQHSR